MQKLKWVQHTPARFARAVKNYSYATHTCLTCGSDCQDYAGACTGGYILAQYTSKNGKWVLLQVQQQGTFAPIMHCKFGANQSDCNWGDIITSAKKLLQQQ